MSGECLGAAQFAEHGGMADLLRWHVQRLEFRCELLRIVDVRKQIGDRDQLAVVQPTTHEAGVVVAALFTVCDDIHAGAFLGGNRQSHRIIGSLLEILFGQPAAQPVVQRTKQPPRPWPTADAHDRKRRDAINCDGECHRLVNRRGDHRFRFSHARLSHQETALVAGLGLRDQLVACQPAPSRKLDFDGGIGGADFQQLSRIKWVDVPTDQQQQTVAAIEVAAVETDVRREQVLVEPVVSHCGRSVVRVTGNTNRIVQFD